MQARGLPSCTSGGGAPSPAITARLKGTWKAGTTKTYALSQKGDGWTYTLTVTPPVPAAYKDQETKPYTITSYRSNTSGTQQPVAWKITGYDANDDDQFSIDEKPDGLTSLSSVEGDGGSAAQTGTAGITTSIIDRMAEREDALKNATPLGAAGGHTLRSTANCYVVSAPGHYKLSLVYGNAISRGENNEHAYRTNVRGSHVLSNFKVHNGEDITDPWITRSNGGKNIPDGARLVWADERGLVTNLKVTGIMRPATATATTPPAGRCSTGGTTPTPRSTSPPPAIAMKRPAI